MSANNAPISPKRLIHITNKRNINKTHNINDSGSSNNINTTNDSSNNVELIHLPIIPRAVADASNEEKLALNPLALSGSPVLPLPHMSNTPRTLKPALKKPKQPINIDINPLAKHSSDQLTGSWRSKISAFAKKVISNDNNEALAVINNNKIKRNSQLKPRNSLISSIQPDVAAHFKTAEEIAASSDLDESIMRVATNTSQLSDPNRQSPITPIQHTYTNTGDTNKSNSDEQMILTPQANPPVSSSPYPNKDINPVDDFSAAADDSDLSTDSSEEDDVLELDTELLNALADLAPHKGKSVRDRKALLSRAFTIANTKERTSIVQNSPNNAINEFIQANLANPTNLLTPTNEFNPNSSAAASPANPSAHSKLSRQKSKLNPHKRANSFSRSKSLARSSTLKRSNSSRNLFRSSHRGSALYLNTEVSERALLCLWPNHPLRRAAIWLAQWPWFVRFNLLAIAMNCVLLMVDNSTRNTSQAYTADGSEESTLAIFDLCFVIIFTFEMLVRTVAGGFIFAGPTSYLQSSWNRLDFLVVILALLNFIPSFSNFTYLRSLKLFRPLKAASGVPGLRVMMSAMYASTLALGNVFLFVFLLLFTFGLLGLQFAMGSFQYRCVAASSAPNFGLLYSPTTCNPSANGVWGFSAGSCPPGSSCIDTGVNPYANVVGYDNMAQSWLMSLIVMSGEGWSDLMYLSEDAVSAATLWYYLALTCFANYLGGELVVAVMAVRFEDAKEAEKQKLREERAQQKAIQQATEAMKQLRQKRKQSGLLDQQLYNKTSSIIQLAAVIKERNRRQSSMNMQLQRDNRLSQTFNQLNKQKTRTGSQLISNASKLTLNQTFNYNTNNRDNNNINQNTNLSSNPDNNVRAVIAPSPAAQSILASSQENSLNRAMSNYTEGQPVNLSEVGSRNSKNTSKTSASSDIERMPSILNQLTAALPGNEGLRRLLYAIRIRSHRIIFNKTAALLGNLATIINCICLGCYYWGMDPTFKYVLDTFNLVLTICFLVEFALRFIGLGLDYFKHGYFILDFIVIIVAVTDLFLPDSVYAFRALRAFRVFRMFIVFRDWAAMRTLMKQVHRSLSDLGYFSLVLALFVFLFAQLGVQISKGKLNLEQGLARDNMDNLGWAAIVVFQLSTPENWNQVLYDFKQGTGWGGAVYIVITMIIGHYVIESLFVVVMLSNFGTDPDEADELLYQQIAAQNSLHANELTNNKTPAGESLVRASNVNPSSTGLTDGREGVIDLDNRHSKLAHNVNAPNSHNNTNPATALSSGASTPVKSETARINAITAENLHVTAVANNNEEAVQEVFPAADQDINPSSALSSMRARVDSSAEEGNIIHKPGGFFQGQAPIKVPGFVRRLGKNIAISKARAARALAEREEKEFRSRHGSPSTSRNNINNGSQMRMTRSHTNHRASKDNMFNLDDEGEQLATYSRSQSRHQLLTSAEDHSKSAASSWKFRWGKAKTFHSSENNNNNTASMRAAEPVQKEAATINAAGSTHIIPPLKRQLSEGNKPISSPSHLLDAEALQFTVQPPVITPNFQSPQHSPSTTNRSLQHNASEIENKSSDNNMLLLPGNPRGAAGGGLISLSNHRPAKITFGESNFGPNTEASQSDAGEKGSKENPISRSSSNIAAAADNSTAEENETSPVGEGEVIHLPSEEVSYQRQRSDGSVFNMKQQHYVIPHHYITPNSLFYTPEPPPFTSGSLFLFSPDSSFRNKLCTVVHSDWWNMAVFILILFSCILLALDYPTLDRNSNRAIALQYLEYITTSLYVLEMVARVIVFGLIISPDSYLRERWNLMEFAIVVISLVSLAYPGLGLLRASRALRPLRLLSRIPSARIVVSSLAKSMSNISNVATVSFILLYLLAVVGVQLFEGRLQQCLTIPDAHPLHLSQAQCTGTDKTWANPTWTGNYDNIFNSLLVMFELCTEENWPGTMTTATDATQPGFPPIIQNDEAVGIYFVVCLIVGSLFIKNLFTATILDGYSLNYAEITGAGGEATETQQLWMDFYKLAVDNKPQLSIPRPRIRWFSMWDLRARRAIYDFCRTKWFEYIFLCVISINILTLSMPHANQSDTYNRGLLIVNSICTWIFVAEIIILWLGIGVKQYFKSGWNCFDFIVVCASVFEFFVDQRIAPVSLGFNPSFFRVVRMTRIFKLFSKFPRLVQLGNTVWFALPGLYNVGLLMLLLFFVYSILTMNLFGRVKHGYYMSVHANFETWTSAMVTLFRMVTGENWNGIMRDCMIEQPFCSGVDCGNSIVSPIVFVSFMILSSMLVMDLIVAIVLNQFENELEKEKRLSDAFVRDIHVMQFGKIWSEFSGGKIKLHLSKFSNFLRALDEPWINEGEKQLLSEGQIYNFIDSLKLPSSYNSVHYLDVIHQLAERRYYLLYPHTKPQCCNDAGNSTTAAAYKSIPMNSLNILSVAGIPLVNEDLKLIRVQAQREYSELQHAKKWCYNAGYVNRIVLVQKCARGFLGRLHSPIKKQQMIKMKLLLQSAIHRNSNNDPQHPSNFREPSINHSHAAGS
jgi:hypothetical protein